MGEFQTVISKRAVCDEIYSSMDLHIPPLLIHHIKFHYSKFIVVPGVSIQLSAQLSWHGNIHQFCKFELIFSTYNTCLPANPNSWTNTFPMIGQTKNLFPFAFMPSCEGCIFVQEHTSASSGQIEQPTAHSILYPISWLWSGQKLLAILFNDYPMHGHANPSKFPAVCYKQLFIFNSP